MATTGQDVLFAKTMPYNKWTFRFRILMGLVSGLSVYYFAFLLLSWSFPSFSGLPVAIVEKTAGILGAVAFFAVTEKLEKIWYGDSQEWWRLVYSAFQQENKTRFHSLFLWHIE